MSDEKRYERFYSKDMKGVTLDASDVEGDILFGEEEESGSHSDFRMPDIVAYVKEHTDLPPALAKIAVHAVFAQITDALGNGEVVRISNFGTFKSVECQAYKVRHPQTGQIIPIKQQSRPRFKASKHLKDAVN